MLRLLVRIGRGGVIVGSDREGGHAFLGGSGFALNGDHVLLRGEIRDALAGQKWRGLDDLYRRCDHIFSELDLIPEKICNLAEWALFVASCGDLDESRRLVKVACQINELTSGDAARGVCGYQKVLLGLVWAVLEKKVGRYFEALEYAQQALGFISDLENKTDNRVCDLHSELLILMIECSLELGMREAAFEQLVCLKEFASRFPEVVSAVQIDILSAELALKFENYPLSSDEWLALIKNHLAEGNVDFALNQSLRVLSEYHRNYPLVLFEGLQKYHDSILKFYGEKVPDKFRQSFLAHVEFNPKQVGVISAHHLMLKLVELTRELVSEHDMNLLALKVLKMLLDFTRMERGMLFFAAGHELSLKSTHRFSGEACGKPNTTEALCVDLVKNCMQKIRTVSISDWTSDEQFLAHFSADRHARSWRKIDAKSLMVIPFVLDKNVLGIVYLDSSSRRPSGNEDEIVFLENFAGIVTVALSHATTIRKKDHGLVLIRKELLQQQSQLVEKYSIPNFLGVSPLTKRLLGVIEKISGSSATVLLTGESGVGKEMVAKMIHYNSPCRDKRFVGINCAAIPDTLLESVLFGYRKGAFTDAHDDKTGLFEEADGGTIFLDEIGEMPLNMQVKLLRVLEEGEVLPIGATEPVKIGTRVVCATNRDLANMMLQGTFRQDLFYRINVVAINVPSLRERRQDIPILVQHALKLYGQENGVEPKSVSPEVLDCLLHYDWPGNIRELINVMFNLSIFVEGDRIELEHLRERPEIFRSGNRRIVVDGHDPILSLSDKIDVGELTLADAKHEFERLQILRALRLSSGKVTSASLLLRMPRPQVSRLIKKYGIRKDIGQQDS